MRPEHVRACLDTICKECGYASVAELAATLDLQKATVSAWQTRNTWGGDRNLARIYDLTGADANWLLDRSDIAFPNGPKINPTLKLTTLLSRIRELKTFQDLLIAASVEAVPELAGALAKRMLAFGFEDSPLFRELSAALAARSKTHSQAAPVRPLRPRKSQ